jgi:competence ComEA-like helix-hairpin-helix protein
MNEKIDINVADAETLTTISGIGPALAQRIVEYRETVHLFEEVIELTAVPGISERMVRGFEDFVMVQSPLRTTAVPLQLDEPEDIPLLAAPDPVELLASPSEPAGLLAAELPEPELAAPAPEAEEIAEEAVVEEEIVVEEPVEAAASEVSEPAEAAEAAPVVEEPSFYVEPETTPETSSVPAAAAAVPPQPAIDWEAKAQRRGCINTLLGATFGAILGAALTLAILAALNNGSLNYDSNQTQLQQQLDTEIISRTNELNQLSTRVSLVATEEAAASQSLQSEFATANEAINEELSNNQLIISYLATRSGDLELRLQEVAGAADTFTGFLDGLRLLLDDLDEGTGLPTPAPFGETVSPTPTPFNATTPLPEPTTAVQPTRTAQPTATPFTFPTTTPAPQP